MKGEIKTWLELCESTVVLANAEGKLAKFLVKHRIRWVAGPPTHLGHGKIVEAGMRATDILRFRVICSGSEREVLKHAQELYDEQKTVDAAFEIPPDPDVGVNASALMVQARNALAPEQSKGKKSKKVKK